jgi:hypothetical protein
VLKSPRSTGAPPDEVAAILPSLTEKTGCAEWSIIRKPLQRRDCRIYFLKAGSSHVPDMVVKIYRKDAVGANLARKLHRKSRRLSRIATPEWSIPKPVLFVQEANALVMEFVEAPLVGTLLIRAFHSKAKHNDIIRQAARWLGWFHRHSGVDSKPFSAESFTGKLAKMLGKISDTTPDALAGDGFLVECIEKASKVATDLDGRLMPHADVHGDFTPFNLFMDRGTVIGFDYRGNRSMPIYHDICRFLVYIDVYRITPPSTSDLRQHGCRKNDFDVFMTSYAPDGEPIDPELLLKLQFLEITRRLTSLKVHRAKVRNRVFRFIEMAHLRRNARHILHVLKSNG